MSSGSPSTVPPRAHTVLAQTHLLWDNGQGTAALWRIAASGETAKTQMGPFAGWAARALAVGPDGAAQVLWTGPGGMASVWRIAEDGGTQHTEYGPYAGWEAAALAAGRNDVQYLLWRSPLGGAILWTLRPQQAAVSRSFGPYDGWQVSAASVGPDGQLHLLWQGRDGQAGIWRWAGGSGRETDEEIASQVTYGPYDGWRAVAVAGDRTGASRLLWRGAGGQASLWTVGAEEEGGAGERDEEERPQRVHGPFAGWTAVDAACGAGEDARLLWRHDGGGRASVWRIAADGGVTHEEYGPYTGWVPVALALGP